MHGASQQHIFMILTTPLKWHQKCGVCVIHQLSPITGGPRHVIKVNKFTHTHTNTRLNFAWLHLSISKIKRSPNSFCRRPTACSHQVLDVTRCIRNSSPCIAVNYNCNDKTIVHFTPTKWNSPPVPKDVSSKHRSAPTQCTQQYYPYIAIFTHTHTHTKKKFPVEIFIPQNYL